MRITQADRETLSKNILDNIQATYQRESAVYKRALKALLSLSDKDRDALYALSIASRKIQDRTQEA